MDWLSVLASADTETKCGDTMLLMIPVRATLSVTTCSRVAIVF